MSKKNKTDNDAQLPIAPSDAEILAESEGFATAKPAAEPAAPVVEVIGDDDGFVSVSTTGRYDGIDDAEMLDLQSGAERVYFVREVRYAKGAVQGTMLRGELRQASVISDEDPETGEERPRLVYSVIVDCPTRVVGGTRDPVTGNLVPFVVPPGTEVWMNETKNSELFRRLMVLPERAYVRVVCTAKRPLRKRPGQSVWTYAVAAKSLGPRNVSSVQSLLGLTQGLPAYLLATDEARQTLAQLEAREATADYARALLAQGASYKPRETPKAIEPGDVNGIMIEAMRPKLEAFMTAAAAAGNLNQVQLAARAMDGDRTSFTAVKALMAAQEKQLPSQAS